MKTSKAELERRKAAAAKEDRFRKKMEAKIAQGRVEVLQWDDAVVRVLMGETLPDDVLIERPRFSPAMEFLHDRTKGKTGEQLTIAWRQAMIDLLSSEIPLDRSTRRHISAEMWKLTYPQPAKRVAIRAKLAHYEERRAELERRGWKRADADDEIAKEMEHESGEALRRWVLNHRRVLDEDI